MRKHIELQSLGSCLNRAGHNEMMFVILSRDSAAPATIRFWIAERIRQGKNQATDPEIMEAETCAKKMEQEKEIFRPEQMAIGT